MELSECIKIRRDTRHFSSEPIDEKVLDKAFEAAHMAPSVGLSEPWRYVIVKTRKVKEQIYENFLKIREQMESRLDSEKERQDLHKKMKLEAIQQAPIGIAVFCRCPEPEEFTLGLTKPSVLEWSVACSVQNLWLTLTAHGYGAGWVSILEFDYLKKVLNITENWNSMGYLCVGLPKTDYQGVPMLELEGWKNRTNKPIILER